MSVREKRPEERAVGEDLTGREGGKGVNKNGEWREIDRIMTESDSENINGRDRGEGADVITRHVRKERGR